MEDNKNDYEKEYKDLELKYKKLSAAYSKLKTTNEVSIDLSNSDDRKTVMQLMEEGKILTSKDKNRKFIVAKQNQPIYEGSVAPVNHTIYIDGIKNIIVKRYYEDYALIQNGNRKFIRQIIWCYHDGYQVSSTISEKDLTYLVSNGLINKSIITYSDVDASTGTGYTSKPYGLTAQEVAQAEEYRIKQYKKQSNLSDDKEDEEVKEVKEEPKAINEEPKIEEVKELKEEVINDKTVESVDMSDIDLEDIAL